MPVESLKNIAKATLPFDLPLGLYLLQKNGEFVDCNTRLREILELPEGEIKANIADFYKNSKDRERLCKMADEADPPGSFIENQKVCFKVKNQDKWVEITCRAHFKPGVGKIVSNIIGYEGYIRDINEEEGLRNLFEQVPTGVYRLDKDDKLILVNKALTKMLGYDNEEELRDRSVRQFYADPTLEDEIQKELIQKGFIVNRQVELVKKNGEKILVKVNATAIKDYEGQYAGREGIILDVTTEATYRHILDEMPIGTYIIRNNDKDEAIITACNNAFATIFGYEKAEDIQGHKIAELYMHPDDQDEFVQMLYKAKNNDEALVSYPIRAKKKDGSEVTIEVHGRLSTNHKGKVIGRVGAVRDISEEVVLFDLKEDVGRTLHVYSSTLMMIEHALNPVRVYLKRAPFDIKETVFEYDSVTFNHLAELLKNHLEELLNMYGTKDNFNNSFLKSQFENLIIELLNLKDYKERIKYWVLQVPGLHDTATNISNICDKLLLDDEILDLKLGDVLKASEDLERFCNIITLKDIEISVLESDHQVSTFRDYVTFHKKTQESKESHSIHNLIQQAIKDHIEFARVKKVDIEYEEPMRKYMVRISRRHLTRAISNLIHNAVKYSWTKQRKNQP
ncbi:MAG: PAS domain S-box protein [candidate division Zixibacteria bacterium]|nr:PAS domain S-box protein [candidate division Zixibacteria bacterium]